MLKRYLEVDSFFHCGVHGALVCRVFVGLVEDGSVCWEGPTNVLALSAFICPPVSLFVQRVSPMGLYLDENCEETLVDSFSEF